MRIALRFHGKAQPSVEFGAETDAEKAILSFLAEGYDRRWKAAPQYSYRPGGLADLTLMVELLADETTTVNTGDTDGKLASSKIT